MTLRLARLTDVPAIHALRRTAALVLTRRHGRGPWSKITISNTLRRAVQGGTLFVFRAVCIQEGHAHPGESRDPDARHGRGPRLTPGWTDLNTEGSGDIVATCTLGRESAAFYAKLGFAEPEAPAFYLRSMSVHPDWQGRGIGRAVMMAVEERARAQGVSFVRLDAYAGVAGAGGFYAKCGYIRLFSHKHKGEELEFFEKRLL